MCNNLESSMRIVDVSNERIFARNFPSQNLQSYLSVRPVMTKYSILPIVDPRTPAHVPMKVEATYNSKYTFNPGNTTSPWSGFASNVNVESELRNQIYALQKCSQSVYVPSSESDLYQFTMQNKNATNQPFPELFKTNIYSDFNPNSEQIAQGSFYNHTRQQMKQYGDTNEEC
jgi:hypothetical protein